MGGSYLNSGADLLNYSYPAQVFNVTQNQAPPQQGGMVPSVQQAVTGLILSVPKWASAFPNLWGYVSRFKRPGRAIAGLVQFLGRFGPTALAALVGAQVVSELFAYKVTHKRRRMNPANSRALRRSLRRLHSFDRLCHRVQGQLHRSGGRSRARSRCARCRKSPCSC
jgi:hypothetical protein